jgi:hypothetical protein
VANFTQFCAWATTLRHADIAALVGDETARVFLDHVAAFTTPEEALDLLTMGSGSITVPLRGVRYASSASILSELQPSAARNLRGAALPAAARWAHAARVPKPWRLGR